MFLQNSKKKKDENRKNRQKFSPKFEMSADRFSKYETSGDLDYSVENVEIGTINSLVN